jgi:hypothetical protein
MGQAERAEGPVVSEPRSPEEIRADIADTREEVGDTVEALAAKTDVKAQMRQRIDTVKAKVQSSTPASAQQGSRQLATTVRENPAPLVVGGAVLVAFLLGRRSVRP